MLGTVGDYQTFTRTIIHFKFHCSLSLSTNKWPLNCLSISLARQETRVRSLIRELKFYMPTAALSLRATAGEPRATAKDPA